MELFSGTSGMLAKESECISLQSSDKVNALRTTFFQMFAKFEFDSSNIKEQSCVSLSFLDLT